MGGDIGPGAPLGAAWPLEAEVGARGYRGRRLLKDKPTRPRNQAGTPGTVPFRFRWCIPFGSRGRFLSGSGGVSPFRFAGTVPFRFGWCVPFRFTGTVPFGS